MKINKKKFIYLISPLKIKKSFYSDLIKIFKTNKVSFFQLRLKKKSFNQKLIIEGQKKFNLIGKSTLGSIWLRHFADSAKLLKILKEVYQNSEGKVLNLLDVGSGAGFPGVVLSIMTNAEKIPIKVALADSNRKKSLFLKIIKKEFGVSYTVVNKRSENIKQNF